MTWWAILSKGHLMIECLFICLRHSRQNKKVKFYCKSDHELFCSKCVLKHTNAKHEVMPASYKSKIVLLPLQSWT